MDCPRWPQDSDFRLVAFTPGAKKCRVIGPEALASDIGIAVRVLEQVPEIALDNPDWYGRLRECAAGAGTC